MRRILGVVERARLVLIALLLICATSVVLADDAANPRIRSQAYVTLLYGEDFLLGVRVLGESLRRTGTTRYVQVHMHLCGGWCAH